MATSVVPAAFVALQALLEARAGLEGVQVTDGYPTQPEAEYIALLDAEPHEQRTAGMRATPHAREEEFVMLVAVSALRKGDDDHAIVTARAYELAAEMENALRNDPTIGGSLGNGWATVVGLPVRKHGPDNDGRREALIEARISCRARI